MPNISLIPVPLFNPLDPYFYTYDNAPLVALETQISLVNNAVDNQNVILSDSIGTAGTLANRLNQSLNPDGSLITAAVNATLHTMDDHTDTSNFVRMELSERDKLALIADQATNLSLTFHTANVTISSGTVEFVDTVGIAWQVTGPNQIRANLGFPVGAAHVHMYDMSATTSDDINFVLPSACMEGTLRVYINGIRLSASESVYVPDAITFNESLFTFTPNESAGTFALSQAISDGDVVRVDYDIAYI